MAAEMHWARGQCTGQSCPCEPPGRHGSRPVQRRALQSMFKDAREELFVKPLVVVAALAALMLASPAPGLPHTTLTLESLGKHIEALRDDLHTGEALKARATDVEAIKTGQQALHTDLQELHTLLQARPAAAAAPAAPPRVVLNVEGAPFKGEKTATLTLIAFTDFQ
jgi:hypothetical protein